VRETVERDLINILRGLTEKYHCKFKKKKKEKKKKKNHQES